MSLLRQHSGKLQKTLEFRNLWSAGFYESVKTPYYCLLQLTQAEKEEEWGKGKDKEVAISLKLWIELMQSRGSRISGPVLKEKAEDFGRRLGRDFKASDGWLSL
ncbi:hypothetical protein MXB_3908 [Myxobolus squamalis]|nr:hypothetical protein MXB_3908 [Myxobolus squamalis]